MKSEFIFHCNKCGYDHKYVLGDENYDDQFLVDLRTAIESGDCGDRLRREIEREATAKVDVENCIYQCSKCGDFVEHDYIRVVTSIGNVSDRYYCKKCGGSTRRVIDVKNADFNCPECGEKLHIDKVKQPRRHKKHF